MYIRQYTSRPSFGLGSLTAPFEGTFVGTMTSDGTKAAVSVTLRQQGSGVEGEIALGAGLQVDFGGACGLEPIDLRSIPIKGQTAADNPMKFTATTEIREPTTKFGANFVVATMSVVAVLKADGQSGTATIVMTPVRTEPKRPLLGCKAVTRDVTLTKQSAAPAPVQGLGLTPTHPTDPWKDLITFVPPPAVQTKVRSKCALTVASRCMVNWAFNKIEQGAGDANLDYYAVQITKPPTLKNQGPLGPDALLSHIRTNLHTSLFIDPKLMAFRQFDNPEHKIWTSITPLGAFLRLDFYLGLGFLDNVDDGTVVVSDYSPRRWRVYTLWNLSDHGHPVSGVREWGYEQNDGGYVIYTRGTDRITKSLMLPFKNQVYAAQHAVWISFQAKIAQFVNGNGGRATVGTATAQRYDWSLLTSRYGAPQGWVP